ncbi:MFS transporter [Ochrobactrum sp. MYb379]|uniref:MFS transporter n=1 Tax=Ochrobactrum sp. MYb379 TaxID=2745275 RepID=UPI0030B3F061
MALFAPLRNRDFASVWVAYSLSIAATTVLPTVLTLWILDWNQGVGALGIALSGRTFGFLAGALIGGNVADRFDRRNVLAIACLIRGGAALAIAWLTGSNLIAVTACLFLAGSGEGAFRSAYQSIMPDILPDDLLQPGNALSTLSGRIIQTAGPMLAVMLYAVTGVYIVITLASIGWIAASLIIFSGVRSVPMTRENHTPSESLLCSVRQGFSEARKHRWFLAGIFALLVWLGIGSSAQQLLLPIISREALGGNSFMGYALASYAIGALVGGIILAKWRTKYAGLPAFIGLALYGLVPFALLSQSTHLIVVAYFLGGFGIELFNIPWFTAIQREVPRPFLGRVTSIDFLVSYGAAPLALALMPLFINIVGQNITLTIAGCLVVSAPILALFTPGALRLKDPNLLTRNKAADNHS